MSKAADRMHVHGNTIRYRITRASPKNSRSTSTIRPRGYGCGSDSFRQT
ncbi:MULTISPECIES: helix-turn-helix domain-containing protein [Rhodococcus]|uniref:Helix-turn-helix domain-containing protein n=1 Tax=Rhodococcus jostii TaxID=132919 RepID=A0ABU4CEV9_RHOJO|nr:MULTISPECIES: helix-turn-helix domain-containing protein [Rhodococcus]MDI9978130.1 helix-turn-helix domain-containing protein [Rhodococcus sp. IEGM 1307]MDV6282094.1 helix-turn-helix domain-containing protein [Rhodococcus jostii]